MLIVGLEIILVGGHSISSREVVFSIGYFDISSRIEVFVGTNLTLDCNIGIQFFLCNAMNCFSPSFVLENGATGNEPLSFCRFVLTFTQNHSIVYHYDEIDRNKRHISDYYFPLPVGDILTDREANSFEPESCV